MVIDSIPNLGPINSLRFATNPDKFMAAGRQLGAGRLGAPAWSWTIHTARGFERCIVVERNDHAKDILGGLSVFLDGEILAPLVGDRAGLLDLPTSVPFGMPWQVDPSIIAECIDASIKRHSEAETFDMAVALHEAAIMVAQAMLGTSSTRSFFCARRFLRLADTPMLVAPFMRRLFRGRWRQMLEARDAWIGSLAPCSDPVQTSRRLLVLLGSVDAPVSLALQAMGIQAGLITPRHKETACPRQPTSVDLALRDPPFPLLLRRLTGRVYLDGIGELAEGQVVAVDAGFAGLPFGFGRHHCAGAEPGRVFAETALEVAAQLDVRVHMQELPRVRRRLAVCVKRMMCKRRRMWTSLI